MHYGILGICGGVWNFKTRALPARLFCKLTAEGDTSRTTEADSRVFSACRLDSGRAHLASSLLQIQRPWTRSLPYGGTRGHGIDATDAFQHQTKAPVTEPPAL